MSFYSNAASNSNLSRYETLKGEMITLEDVEADDISEIEIFGNTVQDSDNLEDIQSVGELYVNKEGEPILDKLGREQYKIDIESCNLPNSSISLTEFSNLKAINKNGFTGFNINNIEYVIAKLNDKSLIASTGRVKIYETLLEIGVEHKIVPLESFENYFIIYNWNDIGNGAGKDVLLKALELGHLELAIKIKNIPLLYNNLSSINQSHKTTILLPCQLQKVGNVYDRLYWDGEKDKYVVEKNIKTMILDASDDEKWGGYGISCYWPDPQFTKHNVISSNSAKPAWTNGVYIHPHGLIYLFHGLGEMSNAQFKQWLSENPVTIVFEPTNSELIETNITKKIKLTTYPEKTYISIVTENDTKSTLKITVDRIEQVSQEAVDNAISSPTSNNIVLARMFVNQLPDSLYKDQLQTQLNEIFSSDIVLEKQSATANLDVYIQSENILMMSLDTNTVTFENYSGVEELELQNAINISINSSLPYQLNAYIVGAITNKDKNKTLDLNVLNIKDSSTTEYKKFDSINNKLILLDNISKGNNISHNIDLKLSGNNAHDADVYKTTIKFEAEQK